jgi:hypothetical protein
MLKIKIKPRLAAAVFAFAVTVAALLTYIEHLLT